MRSIFLLMSLIATFSAQAGENVAKIPLNRVFTGQMSNEALGALNRFQHQIPINAIKIMGGSSADVLHIDGGTPVAIDDAVLAIVEDQISQDLTDPYSAVFSDHLSLAFGDDHGSIVVCGWVNAKNAFSGYAGKRPFIVSLSNPHRPGGVTSTGALDEVWVYESCKKMGLLEW